MKTWFESPMMRVYILSCVLGLAHVASSAHAETRSTPTKPSRTEWNAYWNQGKAELTSYDLKQARYGEIHDGRAVLVFVTEPFSRSKQVKLDYPRSDGVEVLKLNHTRKFNTGIYPYSTMRSVFTPTDGTPTIKLTTSVQEWCGHVFMQLNRKGEGMEGRAFSYFEFEGDQTLSIPKGTLLEDDVWTTARIDPTRLPTGSVSMLPGSVFMRLLHVTATPQAAVATLRRQAHTQGPGWRYEVRYPRLGRTLTIDLEGEFPYRIIGWTEDQQGRGQASKTVAVRKKTLMTDYWNKNSVSDRAWRQKLALPTDF
ncbi:MAG: septum formation inhibitor Maf [Myxococcota bacterium]